MNSQNTALVGILIDMQKLNSRFSDTCRKMTRNERKAAKELIPDVEEAICNASGLISDLILDYFTIKD